MTYEPSRITFDYMKLTGKDIFCVIYYNFHLTLHVKGNCIVIHRIENIDLGYFIPLSVVD
jgi:hypothetical protein